MHADTKSNFSKKLPRFTFRSKSFQLSIGEKKRFVRMNYEAKRFNCFYSRRLQKILSLKIEN